ncbi:MAG: fibronectin type III domain-containing protein, partial [Candidatus Ancillula sp.]|nr:fibronectin type III domain-containing protein [Candidatus Ancillula sp.]
MVNLSDSSNAELYKQLSIYAKDVGKTKKSRTSIGLLSGSPAHFWQKGSKAIIASFVILAFVVSYFTAVSIKNSDHAYAFLVSDDLRYITSSVSPADMLDTDLSTLPNGGRAKPTSVQITVDTAKGTSSDSATPKFASQTIIPAIWDDAKNAKEFSINLQTAYSFDKATSKWRINFSFLWSNPFDKTANNQETYALLRSSLFDIAGSDLGKIVFASLDKDEYTTTPDFENLFGPSATEMSSQATNESILQDKKFDTASSVRLTSGRHSMQVTLELPDDVQGYKIKEQDGSQRDATIEERLVHGPQIGQVLALPFQFGLFSTSGKSLLKTAVADSEGWQTFNAVVPPPSQSEVVSRQLSLQTGANKGSGFDSEFPSYLLLDTPSLSATQLRLPTQTLLQLFITAQELNERKKQEDALKSTPAQSTAPSTNELAPTSAPSAASNDSKGDENGGSSAVPQISGHVDANKGADGQPVDAVVGADKLLEDGLKAQNASSTETQTPAQNNHESNPVAVLSVSRDPSSESEAYIPAVPESESLFTVMAAETSITPQAADMAPQAAGDVKVTSAKVTSVNGQTIQVELKFSAAITLADGSYKLCQNNISYYQCVGTTTSASIISGNGTTTQVLQLVNSWGLPNADSDITMLAIKNSSLSTNLTVASGGGDEFAGNSSLYAMKIPYTQGSGYTNNAYLKDYSTGQEIGATPSLGNPTLETPVVGENSATVSWTAADQATSYKVEYSTNANAINTAASGCSNITALQCTITGLNTNTTYYYKITATDGSSVTSVEGSFKTVTFVYPVRAWGESTSTSATTGTFRVTVEFNTEISLLPSNLRRCGWSGESGTFDCATSTGLGTTGNIIHKTGTRTYTIEFEKYKSVGYPATAKNYYSLFLENGSNFTFYPNLSGTYTENTDYWGTTTGSFTRSSSGTKTKSAIPVVVSSSTAQNDSIDACVELPGGKSAGGGYPTGKSEPYFNDCAGGTSFYFPASGVQISPSTASIDTTTLNTAPFTATVLPTNGVRTGTSHASASNPVIFSSGTTSVAQIDASSGVVTPQSAGTSQISATVDGSFTKDGTAISATNLKPSATLTVTQNVPVTSISISGDDTLFDGSGPKTYTVSVSPSTATNKQVQYTVENGACGSIDQTTGVFTPSAIVAESTSCQTTIRATSVSTPTVYVDKTITVHKSITSLSITAVGGETVLERTHGAYGQKLSVSTAPENITDAYKAASWSSSNSTCLQVSVEADDNSGKTATLTPNSSGSGTCTATITATDKQTGTKTATIVMTVVPKIVIPTSLTLSPTSYNLPMNATVSSPFTPAFMPIDATNTQITWSITTTGGSGNNCNTVSVNTTTGELRANSATEGCQLTVTAISVSAPAVTATATIQVVAIAVTSILPETNSTVVSKGDEVCVAIGFQPADATNKGFTAQVSTGNSYVEVKSTDDNKVCVEGKEVGNAIVTITLSDNSAITTTFSVEVTPDKYGDGQITTLSVQSISDNSKQASGVTGRTTSLQLSFDNPLPTLKQSDIYLCKTDTSSTPNSCVNSDEGSPYTRVRLKPDSLSADAESKVFTVEVEANAASGCSTMVTTICYLVVVSPTRYAGLLKASSAKLPTDRSSKPLQDGNGEPVVYTTAKTAGTFAYVQLTSTAAVSTGTFSGGNSTYNSSTSPILFNNKAFTVLNPCDKKYGSIDADCMSKNNVDANGTGNGQNAGPNDWELVKKRNYEGDEADDTGCGGAIPATSAFENKAECRDQLENFNISASAYSNIKVEVDSITAAGKTPGVGIREQFDTQHYGGQDGTSLANLEQGNLGTTHWDDAQGKNVLDDSTNGYLNFQGMPITYGSGSTCTTKPSSSITANTNGQGERCNTGALVYYAQNFLDGKNPVGAKTNTISEVTHDGNNCANNGVITCESGSQLPTSRHSNYEKFQTYSSSAAVFFPKKDSGTSLIEYCNTNVLTSCPAKTPDKVTVTYDYVGTYATKNGSKSHDLGAVITISNIVTKNMFGAYYGNTDQTPVITFSNNFKSGFFYTNIIGFDYSVKFF